MEISYKQEILRKLIHLSSLWMVALIYALPDYRLGVGIFLTVLLLLSLAVERAVIMRNVAITGIYRFFFGKMLRNEVPERGWVISGGPPVLAAAALCSFLFTPFIGGTALAVMLLSDTAAALVGRKIGKHKLVNNKSLEGVIAFVAVGILVVGGAGCFFHQLTVLYWLLGIAGVMVAAVAELFEKQLRFDDNFSIPLIVGVFLSLSMVI